MKIILHKGTRLVKELCYNCKFDGESVENHVWHDKVAFIGDTKFDSATLPCKSMIDGTYYNIFKTDLMKIIMNQGIKKGGIIEGEFTFQKRGKRTGITIYQIK